MSLIGNLEDIGLADLLQFFGLSRKSGVLALRCERGEGRILFRDGLVLGARIIGRSAAQALGTADEAPDEAIDAARRACLESAVIEMFRWEVGEFEFDVRAKPEPADSELLLSHGISAPYLAMEGARALDEAVRERSVAAPPLARGSDLPTPRSGSERADASVPESSDQTPHAIVIIDPDLGVLEWAKDALSDTVSRVHIFQRSELALERIRQYLGRAESPVVLLSPEVSGDPLSGIRDARDFVRRLKAQAPRTRVLWLVAPGAAPADGPGDADGFAERPESAQLRDAPAAPPLAALGRALQAAVRRA